MYPEDSTKEHIDFAKKLETSDLSTVLNVFAAEGFIGWLKGYSALGALSNRFLNVFNVAEVLNQVQQLPEKTHRQRAITVLALYGKANSFILSKLLSAVGETVTPVQFYEAITELKELDYVPDSGSELELFFLEYQLQRPDANAFDILSTAVQQIKERFFPEKSTLGAELFGLFVVPSLRDNPQDAMTIAEQESVGEDWVLLAEFVKVMGVIDSSDIRYAEFAANAVIKLVNAWTPADSSVWQAECDKVAKKMRENNKTQEEIAECMKVIEGVEAKGHAQRLLDKIGNLLPVPRVMDAIYRSEEINPSNFVMQLNMAVSANLNLWRKTFITTIWQEGVGDRLWRDATVDWVFEKLDFYKELQFIYYQTDLISGEPTGDPRDPEQARQLLAQNDQYVLQKITEASLGLPENVWFKLITMMPPGFIRDPEKAHAVRKNISRAALRVLQNESFILKNYYASSGDFFRSLTCVRAYKYLDDFFDGEHIVIEENDKKDPDFVTAFCVLLVSSYRDELNAFLRSPKANIKPLIELIDCAPKQERAQLYQHKETARLLIANMVARYDEKIKTNDKDSRRPSYIKLAFFQYLFENFDPLWESDDALKSIELIKAFISSYVASYLTSEGPAYALAMQRLTIALDVGDIYVAPSAMKEALLDLADNNLERLHDCLRLMIFSNSKSKVKRDNAFHWWLTEVFRGVNSEAKDAVMQLPDSFRMKLFENLDGAFVARLLGGRSESLEEASVTAESVKMSSDSHSSDDSGDRKASGKYSLSKLTRRASSLATAASHKLAKTDKQIYESVEYAKTALSKISSEYKEALADKKSADEMDSTRRKSRKVAFLDYVVDHLDVMWNGQSVDVSLLHCFIENYISAYLDRAEHQFGRERIEFCYGMGGTVDTLKGLAANEPEVLKNLLQLMLFADSKSERKKEDAFAWWLSEVFEGSQTIHAVSRLPDRCLAAIFQGTGGRGLPQDIAVRSGFTLERESMRTELQGLLECYQAKSEDADQKKRRNIKKAFASYLVNHFDSLWEGQAPQESLIDCFIDTYVAGYLNRASGKVSTLFKVKDKYQEASKCLTQKLDLGAGATSESVLEKLKQQGQEDPSVLIEILGETLFAQSDSNKKTENAFNWWLGEVFEGRETSKVVKLLPDVFINALFHSTYRSALPEEISRRVGVGVSGVTSQLTTLGVIGGQGSSEDKKLPVTPHLT